MRKQWLSCLLVAAVSGSAVMRAQTYEVQIEQVVARSTDTVHFEIRQTGTTPFVLTSASFLLNYDTAALGFPTVVSADNGPWDMTGDPDYNNIKSIPIDRADSAAGFAGLLVEFTGGNDNNGPTVPISFTRIGTLSFPIRNGNLTPAFQWRNIGMNSQVTKLTNPGSPVETDITANGVFIPPEDGPLPIQLASFTATVMEGNRVRLDWITLSEINNYGFEVQRSPNTPVGYQSIPNSFVPGHGTTNEPHSYSFIDSTALSGRWLYRLRQIDLDGTEHFTQGIQVNILTGVSGRLLPTEYTLGQDYPNPFNPSTRIDYAIPKESHVRLEVYNLLGQRVAVLVDEAKPAGYYTASLDASGLGSGLYFYRLTAGQVTFTKKMIVLK